jgi:hypothetical protein
MSTRIFSAFLLTAVFTACASATDIPATPTLLVPPIATFNSGTETALTPPAGAANICTDPQVAALFDSLKTSVLTSDGELLSSLVSPANGMDVRYLRDGTSVKYEPRHAKFLYETTFVVDWGLDPASGMPVSGPFHQVVVPKLVESFNQPYTLHCNELKHGAASYTVEFPHDKGFYSIHFPGTEVNGNLDWHTWVAGVEHVDGKPYLYALMQFFWEP